MPTDEPVFHMIPGATQPVAPFSHAVESGGFVFLTGQMPDTPSQKGMLPEGIAAQTRNVMANLKTILTGVGLDLSHVISVRAYLTEFKRDYREFNATYQTYFPEDRLPARTCIGTTGLAYDALVEIDLVARR
ncbi:MAG: RidA family protein [Pseudomonadota bacterium]